VQLSYEFFLHVFGPRIVCVDLRIILLIQQLQQRLQIVWLNCIVLYDNINIFHVNCYLILILRCIRGLHFCEELEVLIVAVLVQQWWFTECKL